MKNENHRNELQKSESEIDEMTSFNEQLYDEYTSELARKVEGFVIINNNYNIIRKYVRYKNGKFTEHIEKGE